MLFLSVIALILQILLSGASARNCSYNGWSHKFYKDSCCRNESYELGHGLRDFAEECYKEPIDDALPFRENHWVFYECIINKTLQMEGRNLTEIAFAEMMSRNLSPGKRDPILRILRTSPTKLVVVNGSTFSSMYRLRLKMYWGRYFNVEFAVCGKVITTRCGKNQVCLANARRDYEPEMFCRPSNSARAANVCKFTKQEFDDCMDSKTTVLKPLIFDGPDAPKMILERARLMCRLIATSRFDPDVEFRKPDCDFEALFNSLIPRFSSTSSRNLLLQNCRKLMERRDIKLDDPPQPFANFVKNFYSGSEISSLGPTEMFLLNLDAALSLATFTDKTQELTCYQQWE